MMSSAASQVLTEENVKKLKDFLADQFGLTSDVDFEGIYPALIALWGSGIPQGVYASLKLAYYIEKQVSTYLAQLGADVAAVENFASSAGSTILKTVSNPANPESSGSTSPVSSGVPGELTGKNVSCAESGGFNLFGWCIHL